MSVAMVIFIVTIIDKSDFADHSESTTNAAP